jgi:hypothetical protein
MKKREEASRPVLRPPGGGCRVDAEGRSGTRESGKRNKNILFPINTIKTTKILVVKARYLFFQIK